MITNQMFYEKLVQPLGYDLGEKFNIVSGKANSPYYVDASYNLRDAEQRIVPISTLMDKEFTDYSRTRAELINDMKLAAAGFTPNWSDATQEKHYIEYRFDTAMAGAQITTQNYVPTTIYFSSRDSLNAFMNKLSASEINTLFGITA